MRPASKKPSVLQDDFRLPDDPRRVLVKSVQHYIRERSQKPGYKQGTARLELVLAERETKPIAWPPNSRTDIQQCLPELPEGSQAGSVSSSRRSSCSQSFQRRRSTVAFQLPGETGEERASRKTSEVHASSPLEKFAGSRAPSRRGSMSQADVDTDKPSGRSSQARSRSPSLSVLHRSSLGSQPKRNDSNPFVPPADGETRGSRRQSRRTSDNVFLTAIFDEGSHLSINETHLSEPTRYSSIHLLSPYQKFRQIARTIAWACNFLKFLSRILKNPIEWTWHYDPGCFANLLKEQAEAKARLASAPMLNRHVSSLQFSISHLFVEERKFEGYLTPEMRSLFRKLPEERNSHDIDTLVRWTSSMRCFKSFPKDIHRKLIEAGSYEKWGSSRTIVKEGHHAMYFYVILDGEIEVSYVDYEGHEALASEGQDYSRAYIHILGHQVAGDSFGELSFVEQTPHATTAITQKPTEFLTISKEEYMDIMEMRQDPSGTEKLEIMQGIPLLCTLSLPMGPLAHYCEIQSFAPNTALIVEGTVPTRIYFLRKGTCRIIKLVKFIKKSYHLGSKTTFHLMPLDRQSPGSGAAVSSADDTDIVTKILVVGELKPGDHFGNETDPLESSGYSTELPSPVTIVTNERVDVAEMAKIDFHKFSTPRTKELLETGRAPLADLENLSKKYISDRLWSSYKRKVVKDIVKMREEQSTGKRVILMQ